MTDEEIIESFRRAKFPAKQVGILSELTLRSKADIIEVLEGAGFDIPNGRVNSSWNKERDAFLVKARAEGRTYEEIARELGVRISFQGFELQPVLDGNGEVFYIQTKYLEPLSGKENLEIFIRRAGDAVYLAVKVGLYLYGIVTPAKAPEELKRMFQMLGEDL